MNSGPGHHEQPTGVGAVLVVTFLASLGSGVFWNGMAFIAEHRYAFNEVRNMTLHAFMGVLYAGMAMRAAWMVRRVERWMSPRAALITVIMVLTAACTLPLMMRQEFALWITAGVGIAAQAVMWPLVESYLSAGRHGVQMRRVIGWFNLTWMSAVVVSMFVMAPLIREHAEWSIGGLALVNLLALPALARFARRPGAHDHVTAAVHVAPSYPYLMRAARLLLPVSYALLAGLAPILPYRLNELDVTKELQTPLNATWMIARVLILVVMWRLPFWHGRWSVLVASGLLLATGFAGVIFASSVMMVIASLTTFGFGLGAVYYTSLYYGMSVGRAEVEASGAHEALIGVGYFAGPMAGLLGAAVSSQTDGRVSMETSVVVLSWIIMGFAAIGITRAYLRWRAVRHHL